VSRSDGTPRGPLKVATDIGGTFTDLVYLDTEDGSIGLAKASTTPPNFERGVVDALDKASIDADSDVVSFAHGSTVVINALTERKGSVTALITTQGFRDALEITRANRPDLFNLRFAKPEPFVERALRFEVHERLNFKGEVLVELDEADVERAARAAAAAGAEAIAICFLHSYANPEHERRCAEVVRRVLPDVPVTMSHEISMEWREYERTSTAVLNAYVQAVAARYLDRLAGELETRGIDRGRYVMQSSGGTTSFERAKERPITLVESGPVAGIMGAAIIGEAIGRPDVIALDIGGTTAKTSLIEHGQVKVTTEYRIGWEPTSPGYPIKVPVVDIVEIGAGGGSIAWLDDADGLHVGPRSAGAVPGPACYPNGGAEPTVTDANLIAGRIDPAYFLGGEIAVSLERAKAAMERIAQPLGVSVEEAALGVIRVANANMVNAIKLVSVRRGHDPRDFDLVAFGGGGSMHAAALAAELRIARVVIPPAPGLFSAWGMLMTEERGDWVRTHVAQTDALDLDDLSAVWGELESTASSYFDADGAQTDGVVLTRSADMRYKGQEHTVKVPVAAGVVDAEAIAEVERRFAELHERHYTFRLDVPVEFVNLHLTALRPQADSRVLQPRTRGGDVADALRGRRMVHYDQAGLHEAAIYERESLPTGQTVDGPAVVEEPAASTLVFPGQRFSVDEWSNVVIEV
jgi:N-methylhydantoinase A